MEHLVKEELTFRDFETDQDVRWCPGCGDYAILAQAQKTMPTFGRKKEDFVFVSGIGCSSRFPYYMNAYGFHSIHGRAPAVASGVKISNPDLSVWRFCGTVCPEQDCGRWRVPDDSESHCGRKCFILFQNKKIDNRR